MEYRKKPIVIEAVLWDGSTVSEVTEWISKSIETPSGEAGYSVRVGNEIHITTLEGLMIASAGDYIIRGIKGEIYPCKPDIFELTYEKV